MPCPTRPISFNNAFENNEKKKEVEKFTFPRGWE
jgi:hypothetical protein